MNGLDESGLVLFSLILMRMSGGIFLNPFLRRSEVPSTVKTGMAFLLTLILLPLSQAPEIRMENSLVFAAALLQEFAVGAVMGFVLELFAVIATMAGAVIDFQMGFSMATVYDAGSNSQSALSGTILYLYFGLLFFAVDGHLAFMKILTESAEVMPYGGKLQIVAVSQAVLLIFTDCVVLAMKLAFPMLAIEFVAEIAVGIMMKVIPQINLFILSIQMKIVIGILVFVFMISPAGDMFGDIITQAMNTVTDSLHLMAG